MGNWPLGVFVRDVGHAGVLAPVAWNELVSGTWRGTVTRQELSVQVVNAANDEPVSGAEIRLIPLIGETVLRSHTVEANASNVALGQATFKVLKTASWQAAVRHPGSKSLIIHPLHMIDDSHTQVRIDFAHIVRIRARDTSGSPVAGLGIHLTNPRLETVRAVTDVDGRAQCLVARDEACQLSVPHVRVIGNGLNLSDVRPRDAEYAITIDRVSQLRFTLEAVGQDPPTEAIVACFNTTYPEQPSLIWWTPSTPTTNFNLAVSRIVVFAPGFLRSESQLPPITNSEESIIPVRLQRGPILRVPRSVLPTEFVSPLKASATALQIGETDLGASSKSGYTTKLFATEFAPSAGDIEFGPLTPGTYAFKILDATGKTVWEETRDVK
jgi:hypothetical protein